MLERFVQKIKTQPEDELVYDYEGLFKDMMAEYDAKIEETIKLKKARYGA